MKLLLIGLLALGSFTAFGFTGAPDEDPIVENLRSRFEKGTEPTADYLLGQAFKCKEMLGRRGEFRKTDISAELRFEAFDGFLTVVQQGTVMHKILYTFNGKELIGATRTKEGILYDAYRVDSKGFLISEFTRFNEYILAELSPISDAKGSVMSYILCVPK